MTEQVPPAPPVQGPQVPLPQPPRRKEHTVLKILLILGVAAVVVIAVIAVIVAVVVNEAGKELEEAGLVNTETRTGSIGEEIPCGLGLVLVVHDAARSEGSEYYRPEPGKYYLVLDIEFRNTGNETEAVSSLMEMSVKDEEGREYSIAFFPQDAQLPEGDILPGEKIRGLVAFELPTDVTSGLVFKFSPLLGDAAFVELPAVNR